MNVTARCAPARAATGPGHAGPGHARRSHLDFGPPPQRENGAPVPCAVRTASSPEPGRLGPRRGVPHAAAAAAVQQWISRPSSVTGGPIPPPEQSRMRGTHIEPPPPPPQLLPPRYCSVSHSVPLPPRPPRRRARGRLLELTRAGRRAAGRGEV